MLPGFREFTTKFYWRCFGVAKELLRAIALGIGLDDEDFFLRFHSGVNNQLRLLHYPPVEAERLKNNEVARELLAYLDFSFCRIDYLVVVHAAVSLPHTRYCQLRDSTWFSILDFRVQQT